MNRTRYPFAIASIALVAAAPAWAHKPVAVTDEPTGPDNALALDDISISQVAYFESSQATTELWLKFEAEASETLYFGAGVPVIDGLENLRPTMVVLGEDFPEADVPFAMPEGYGGRVFPTAGKEPEIFFEPFTGTESWQFPMEELELPSSGRYFLVTFLPDRDVGKFWTVVGRAEQFGLADIISLPRITVEVRLFHEVFPIGGLLLGGLLILLLLVFGLPLMRLGR